MCGNDLIVFDNDVGITAKVAISKGFRILEFLQLYLYSGFLYIEAIALSILATKLLESFCAPDVAKS